jgi:hypothetical protein
MRMSRPRPTPEHSLQTESTNEGDEIKKTIATADLLACGESPRLKTLP